MGREMKERDEGGSDTVDRAISFTAFLIFHKSFSLIFKISSN